MTARRGPSVLDALRPASGRLPGWRWRPRRLLRC